MSEARTWRELLGVLIENSSERQRVINELSINPITLTRWVNGSSRPRLNKVRQLLSLFPKHRELFEELLQEDFGEDVLAVHNEDAEGAIEEIPSTFYQRVLDAHVNTPSMQHFWTICNSVLQQALGHLDPDHTGMAMIVAQCTPPSHGDIVRSLRERVGRGTPPWKGNMDNESMFLGSESLSGYAVSTLHTAVLQDFNNQPLVPAQRVPWEQSAIAVPILRTQSVAGCLLVSSTQPKYFIPTREALIRDYANLLTLAFEPHEFYDIQLLNLQEMPHQDVQRDYFTTFRQRVARVMTQATREQQQINVLKAEQIVWQQLEQELLQHSLSSPIS